MKHLFARVAVLLDAGDAPARKAAPAQPDGRVGMARRCGKAITCTVKVTVWQSSANPEPSPTRALVVALRGDDRSALLSRLAQAWRPKAGEFLDVQGLQRTAGNH